METSLANFTHCASDGTLQVSQTSVQFTNIWSHLSPNISETSPASVSGDLGRGGVVVPWSGGTTRHNPLLAVVSVQLASVQTPHVSTVITVESNSPGAPSSIPGSSGKSSPKDHEAMEAVGAPANTHIIKVSGPVTNLDETVTSANEVPLNLI